MPQGMVVSIHIAPVAGSTASSVKEVRALPGKGLEGDRYYKKSGTFSKEPGSGDVTLIDAVEFSRDPAKV